MSPRLSLPAYIFHIYNNILFIFKVTHRLYSEEITLPSPEYKNVGRLVEVNLTERLRETKVFV